MPESKKLKILISEEENPFIENHPSRISDLKYDPEDDLRNKINDPKFRISTTHPVAVMK